MPGTSQSLPYSSADADPTRGLPLKQLTLRVLHIILMVAFITPRLPAQAQDPIHDFLQPLVDNHSFAGAVTLVAKGDKVVYLQPIGFRDLAVKAPMQPDSLFWIASTSKP